MKKLILILFLLIACPTIGYAQSRINLRYDISGGDVKAGQYKTNFSWKAWELTFEREWKTNKVLVHGFNIGLRKEGKVIPFDGNYLVAGTFRRLNSGNWALYANLEILYGYSGLRFNKTWEKRDGADLLSYTKLYLVRNANVPGMEVKNGGVVYPELSLSLRRKLGHLNIDGLAGVRLLKFGVVESDFKNSRVDTKIVPIPTLAIRVGLHF